MFSSGCRNQSICCVVRIIVAWRDHSVAKVSRLLGIVADICDIADRIVEIIEILKCSSSNRLNTRNSERQRIISVIDRHPIAVLNSEALTASIIVDIRNKLCPVWLTVDLSSADVCFDSLDETCFVVVVMSYTRIRSSTLDNSLSASYVMRVSNCRLSRTTAVDQSTIILYSCANCRRFQARFPLKSYISLITVPD